MKIIARTDTGFLIDATTEDVKGIFASVMGERPEKIKIGQKIPAIDYADTITSLKKLPNDSRYRDLLTYAKDFTDALTKLSDSVDNATKIC